MRTPYRNRLPMAYLPASRAVDTVGMDPMFYGRMCGVGGIIGDIVQRGILPDFGQVVCIPAPCNTGTTILDPAPRPVPAPTPAPATVPASKPTTSALPLLIGAAFLLLA